MSNIHKILKNRTKLLTTVSSQSNIHIPTIKDSNNTIDTNKNKNCITQNNLHMLNMKNRKNIDGNCNGSNIDAPYFKDVENSLEKGDNEHNFSRKYTK